MEPWHVTLIVCGTNLFTFILGALIASGRLSNKIGRELLEMNGRLSNQITEVRVRVDGVEHRLGELVAEVRGEERHAKER